MKFANWSIAAAMATLLVGPAAAQTPAPNSKPPAAAAKSAQPAATPPAPQQHLAVPPPEILLVLTRSSLIALDQANRTNNYSVLREIGGPGMQQHSAAHLSDVFATLRQQQVNLAASAILTPQVTEPPSITPQGMLQIVGFLPSEPARIGFQMVFQPHNNEWRLFGMNVGLIAQTAAAADPAKAGAAQATAKLPISPGAQKALGQQTPGKP